MDFDLLSDHKLLQDSIGKLMEKYRGSLPVGSAAYYQDGSAIAEDVARNGYMDVAAEAGALGALLVVEAVCQLPQSVEIAASALLAPLAGAGDLPRPYAVADGTKKLEGAPIRFLGQAKTVLIDTGADIRALDTAAGTIEEIGRSQFAYPYARFTKVDVAKAKKLAVDPARFRQLRRVALAGEIVGAAQGALDLTVAYVKDRRQFGHPIGSLQAIQHRLSECATFVHGARLLAQKAAVTGEAVDAEMALTFAQELAARISYDSQQFHGALGQTLEYPLHYWSFRLRGLQGEMGGQWVQSQAAAEKLWAA